MIECEVLEGGDLGAPGDRFRVDFTASTIRYADGRVLPVRLDELARLADRGAIVWVTTAASRLPSSREAATAIG